MKTGAAKALTLLTVYLLSTAGAALTALTCHCEHLHAHHDRACHAVECCCGHDHAEHSAMCDHAQAGSVQFAERCCDHNHSTDTELYTADSDKSAQTRIASVVTDAAADSGNESAELLTAGRLSFAERRCPPAQRCRAVLRPLRAPPVCA